MTLVFIIRRLLGLNGLNWSRSLEANVKGLELMMASTSQSSPKGLVIQTGAMLEQQNSEYLAGGADLVFPNATYAAGTWRVENPVCALLAQLASDLVIVHLIPCLSQLVSGTYRI